jgi:DNA-binding Lrp family transcriptional regulator
LIDFLGLGYVGHQLTIKFQYVNSEIEREMIGYLRKSPLNWWCNSGCGSFDVYNLFWSKTPEQFSDLLDKFRMKYRAYIRKAGTTAFQGFTCFGYPFTKSHFPDRIKEAVIGAKQLPKIDFKDRQILRILSSNARAPLSKISKAVGLTNGATTYRIDQLERKKIIVSYKPLIDMKALGYGYYWVVLNLHSMKKQKEIEQRLRSSTNVTYLLKTSDFTDLEFGVFTKTLGEFIQTMNSIRDDFHNEIRDYEYFPFFKNEAESLMPDF